MPKTIDRDAVLPLIYAQVACGRSLDKTLSDEGMPSPSTFWRWHMEDPAIRDNLARARENGVERLMDECVDIADETSLDTIKGKDGDERPNSEWISRSKLRIETRMKMAQMIAPRKYAAMVKHADADGEKLAVDDVSAITRLAALAAKYQGGAGASDDAE